MSWSLNWSQEKLEGYMAVQENTIKFDGLLGQIRGTDADITAKLSDKKDMLKAYKKSGLQGNLPVKHVLTI